MNEPETPAPAEQELCGAEIGRRIGTREMRYCGLPAGHAEPWCVSTEAIEKAGYIPGSMT